MKRTQVLSLEEHLQNTIEKQLQGKKHQLALYIEQMKGLSPLDKLSQGYSYVSDASGRTLSSIEQAEIGDTVTVYVKDGRLKTQITDKQREAWES